MTSLSYVRRRGRRLISDLLDDDNATAWVAAALGTLLFVVILALSAWSSYERHVDRTSHRGIDVRSRCDALLASIDEAFAHRRTTHSQFAAIEDASAAMRAEATQATAAATAACVGKDAGKGELLRDADAATAREQER